MNDSVRTLFASSLGPLSYRDGLALQEGLVAARSDGRTGDWLLYPEHPPVLTMGRGGSRESLKVTPEVLEHRGIELFEVARGGDLTWHGPGQAVGYLVVGLDRCDRDLHRFLRSIERSIEDVLRGLGLDAKTVPGRTGVWVSGEKIASIGVAVRRWVSYHGFALNVSPDLGYFDLIHPCGLRDVQMTSLATLLGSAMPSLDEVRRMLACRVAVELGYEDVRWVASSEPWEFAAASRDSSSSPIAPAA